MRNITFYYTDHIEKETTQPIADEAHRRGYSIVQTDNFDLPSDIGIYCSHEPSPHASNFSAILLHDLGQAHNVWPYYWHKESWAEFDLGFLPGSFWAEMFLQHGRQNRFHMPKRGLYTIGWPKVDPWYDPNSEHEETQKMFRQRFDLDNGKPTILYAPSWEYNGKQDEFVEAFQDLDVNLLIKQALWGDNYLYMRERIQALEDKYASGYPQVRTMPPATSIMDALSLADVLVSDESSVLVEALLFGVPGVAVIDWLIPDTTPPRPACVPFSFVFKTVKKRLAEDTMAVLQGEYKIAHQGKKFSPEQYSNLWFSQKGGCSALVMDCIEATLSGTTFGQRENLCERVTRPSPSTFFLYHSLQKAHNKARGLKRRLRKLSKL